MSELDSPDTDVIVVGAGPAGSTAACLLARAGFDVLILDRSAGIPRKVCGEYLSPGCRRLLHLLGAEEYLERAGARTLGGMLIHTRGGRTLRGTYPESDRSGDDHRGLSIPRHHLDAILLDRARESGARLERGFGVSDLLWNDERVVGVKGHRGGEPRHRKSRLVVGADGRGSVVARRLGSVEWNRSLDRMALVGYFTGIEREEELGEVFLGRNRYTIFNPVESGQTNVGVVFNREEYLRKGSGVDLLDEARTTHPALGSRLVRARPIAPPRALGPLAHRASRLWAPGALLVGDAAGFLDPFTGEGIYAALRSAELAAGFAGRELSRDDADGRDLRAYAAAWAHELGRKWTLCRFLQHAIRRPFLAEWIVGWLSRRPRLSLRVMAAFGDLLPPEELRIGRIILGR